MTFRKEVLTGYVLEEIKMATMDLSIKVALFLPQYTFAKHTVRLGLCLPCSVDKVR